MCTTDEAIARQVAHETEAERLRAALRDLVKAVRNEIDAARYGMPSRLPQAVACAERVLQGDN